MALESLDNRAHTLNSKDLSPRRQRIISESTGLVKFNITRKLFEEKEKANKEFADLEKHAKNATTTPAAKTLTKKPSRATVAHKASYIQLSPQRPEPVVLLSTPSKEDNKHNDNLGLLDENLMLELAAKQREVMELKSNMDAMKKRLHMAEKELHEIERRCNRSTHKPPTSSKNTSSSRRTGAPEVPPKRHQGKPLDQFTTLRSKPSIQILRSSIESQANQTNANIATLRSKMSLPQLKSRASLLKLSDINSATMNENFQKLQKDTNIMIEKGLSFVNNLKNDMFKEEDESDFSDDDSELSDYGCADTSNYQLAVK